MGIVGGVTFDRWLLLAVVVAAGVVVPRSLLISHAHSETYDEQYHLYRGLSFLERSDREVLLNNPPLGAGLVALPAWVMGVRAERGAEAEADELPVLYGQPWSPETILMVTAGWKAVLFLPFVGVVFVWCRRLYGLGGAWLAVGLVLVEPTIAAHTPIAALDVLAMQGIVIACFLAWRYFESPRRGRLVRGWREAKPLAAAYVAVGCAVAMLIKHTAIILPGVVGVMAVLHWAFRDGGLRVGWVQWRRRLNELAAGGLLLLFSIWALTLFDISKPRDYGREFHTTYTERFGLVSDVINPGMHVRLPAGIYLGSFAEGLQHARGGHPAYLLGEFSRTGWWYYWPVVAWYKVPVGVGLALLAAVVSVWFVRPRWEELGLLVPLVIWLAAMVTSNINIGFRHFLPAYIFMLMLAGRAGMVRWTAAVAWAGVVLAGVHVLLWHPNYLSYINYPRADAHLAISDSNIDWGQSLKQVRAWLDANPQDGRDVYLGYFGNPYEQSVEYYLGDRVIELLPWEEPPREGLLIISPVWEAGLYIGGQYMFLQERTPVAVIGDCMRIYVLAEAGEGDAHHINAAALGQREPD